MMIECNYDKRYVLERELSGYISMSASENHLELQDCVDAIEKNYSENLMDVILIHMSGGNCISKDAILEVKSNTPMEDVYVAKAGNVFELKKDDF